jgi:hypothetical protein
MLPEAHRSPGAPEVEGPRLDPTVLRILLAWIAGSTIDLALFAAAFLWMNWSVSNVDCGADGHCLPQYFFLQGVLFFFVILPAAYLAGCSAIVVAVGRSLRKSAVRRWTVNILLATFAILTVALTIMFFETRSASTAAERSFRHNLWYGSVVLGPVLAGAGATFIGVTTGRRRSTRLEAHR